MRDFVPDGTQFRGLNRLASMNGSIDESDLRRGEHHYGFIVFESCAMSVMMLTQLSGLDFLRKADSYLFDRCPTFVGIELGHCAGDFPGVLS